MATGRTLKNSRLNPSKVDPTEAAERAMLRSSAISVATAGASSYDAETREVAKRLLESRGLA